MVNQPNSNDEVVKCVVVGDSGVGKTCLVCAFACNTHYDLKKLVRTHVATVWAIDHYQRDREVLERSWCEVDGVQVSLRLWDTFGYHDKDRRFAYRGADVIVLCFSTVRPSSLRNVKTIWYPEIRHFCPTIPIILVGTQADMRYLYNDEHYLQIEKGLMYRHISEKDIITPTVGHEMAKDIGAPFYESSVLAKFGVNDIFINSIRAALIERRKVRFWNTQLRRVQRPLIQPPMILPPPTMPKVILVPPSPRTGIASLLSNHREGDVTFIARGHCLEAHKIVLAISSRFFKELFSCEQVIKIPPHHQHILQTELLQALKFQSQSMSSENEHLLDNDQAISPEAISNILVMNSSAAKTRNISMNTYPLTISFKHQAFESVEVRYQEDAYNSVQMCLRLFIILHSDITARAFQLVLEFLYSNQICMVANPEIAQEVRRAAELLEIKELLSGLENLRVGEGFLNTSLLKQLQQEKQEKLWKLAHSEESFLPDVTFQVDDGLVSAHKALLMAGCEMMNAMFSNHFLESSADVISFPGLNCETFRVLLEYIYTGEVVNFASADCASLIVTANQLCQPHLVSLVEVHVVSELQRTDVKGFDRVEEALFLLEHAELHNAKQLARWCEKFLCIHYREVTQLHGKMFRSLPKERQEAIERFRWPPVWYLKEIERFERQTHNSIHHPEQRQRQDYNRCFTGCLCFTRRGRHRLNDPVELPI